MDDSAHEVDKIVISMYLLFREVNGKEWTSNKKLYCHTTLRVVNTDLQHVSYSRLKFHHSLSSTPYYY